jgi:ribosomal protein S18 acetylase RimI-like enzyme
MKIKQTTDSGVYVYETDETSRIDVSFIAHEKADVFLSYSSDYEGTEGDINKEFDCLEEELRLSGKYLGVPAHPHSPVYLSEEITEEYTERNIASLVVAHDDDGNCRLLYVEVNKKHQRKGIGSAMMSLAKNYLGLDYIECIQESSESGDYSLTPNGEMLIASCIKKGIVTRDMCHFGGSYPSMVVSTALDNHCPAGTIDIHPVNYFGSPIHSAPLSIQSYTKSVQTTLDSFLNLRR